MGTEEYFNMFTWKKLRLRMMTPGSLFKIGVFLLILNSELAIAQDCSCSGVPCEKNATAGECPSGRLVSRNDCACCFVCVRQLADGCNESDLPCDADFGLVCGIDLKCEAKKPCTEDGECSNDHFCFGGACADPCKVVTDVCQDNDPSNGICTVRNHRAYCSCPKGQTIHDGKCVTISGEDEKKEKIGTLCAFNNKTVPLGEKMYTDKCSKICECEESGNMNCKEEEMTPECNNGLIPMSKVTGEMTEACKILIGNMAAFDGCCVPSSCQNVTTQDHVPIIDSKGRDYKLSEFQNNLGDDDEESTHQHRAASGDDGDELTPSREMLLKEDDHKVLDEILQKVPLKKDPKYKKSSEPEGSMGLIISKTTPHSASIKLPLHDKGAVLSIALSSQLKSKGSESDVWKQHMIPPGLPMLTLSDLLPNTSYTVRYSSGDNIYPDTRFTTPTSDEVIEIRDASQQEHNEETSKVPLKVTQDEDLNGEDKESEMTTYNPTNNHQPTPEEIINSHEIISLTKNGNESISLEDNAGEVAPTQSSTHEGCLYNETLHEFGAIVYEGCDQRCECRKDGQMKCIERCSIPFFKNGSFAHDPLCYEEPSGIDECCVLVACARASHPGTARELTIKPCDTVKCGPNADCRHEVSPAGMQAENLNPETLCVCKENFIGDAYSSEGCEPVNPTSSNASLLPEVTQSSNYTSSVTKPANEKKGEGCVSNNKTFDYGEEYLDGCSYKCHCEASGEFLCLPRCNYRHDEDAKIPDGCKIEKDPSDPECCEILVCAGDSEGIKKEKPRVSPTDGCFYKNKTYEKEEKFYDGCDQQCTCFSNGDVTCQPRCPPLGPSAHLMEKDCITLQDPSDSCCNVTVCGNQTVSDVLKEAVEHERKRLEAEERARILPESGDSGESVTDKMSKGSFPLKITLAMPINVSSILLSVHIPEDELAVLEKEEIVIYYSHDKSAPMKSWSVVTSKVKDLFVEGSEELHTVIGNLESGKEYFFKAKISGVESNILSGITKTPHERPLVTGSMEEEQGSGEDTKDNSGPSSAEAVCNYKNKMFAAGEEFYDGCDEYCVCEDTGAVQCVPFECPTDFGLDLLDSNCVKWEPMTGETEVTPPNCCPEMKCVQNSSCTYENYTFSNLEEIPQKLTGCEKRCYCEYGNVTCHEVCPPITEKPPSNMPCPPELATVVTVATPYAEAECCMAWVCPSGNNNKTEGENKLPNSTHPSTIDQSKPGTVNVTSSHPPPQPPHHHLIHHGIIYDEEDQFIPPSTGNQPTVIPLDKLHPQQLQELLHQLSVQNEAGSPTATHPFGHGIYVSVRRPEEVRDLEIRGAKVVGHGEDHSYILFLPAADHRLHKRPNFPSPPNLHPVHFGPHFQDTHTGFSHDEITGVMIRPLNESTLHIDFTVSPVLVGLQGAVEVLYTNEFSRKPDTAQWEKQLFQQPEDIIDNSHLQLFLSGLKPDSEYHIQIQVIISNIHNSPISDIFVIRTPPSAQPPEIKIDPEIKVLETTSRTIEISWRKFTDFESSLIDGVQIKYKAYDDQLYATSELIHRSISNYKLTNLHPGKKYEVDLLLVPFTNQTTELKSENAIHIETPPEVDDFSFTIAIETGKITEQTAELIWEGVPFPEDKFVNIYQVLYQSDNQKEQKSYFKVASRETSKKAALTDLKPGTRYRVWLEAFLTNGKKKRSNVIDVLTKVGNLPNPEKSEQESNNLLNGSTQGVVQPQTSYYGALVALAIVAALSIIGIIILLMILIKKQNQSKIPINDRKSESSYDNPSFKNYDMEANGHHNNKPTEL